jgi:hypothetical protein
MYAKHENTVINMIIEDLLLSDDEFEDKEELIDWAKSITIKKDTKTVFGEGSRKMVDMCDLVKIF